MSKVVTDNVNYIAIASAIREKLGVSTTYLPSEMPSAIRQITKAANLTELNVAQNGVYTPLGQYNGYSTVTVNVLPRLSRKFIYSSGTYSASADGLEGYNEVIVNIDSQNTGEIFLGRDINNFLYFAKGTAAEVNDNNSILEGTILSYSGNESRIRNCAFYDCSLLQSVNLPNCSYIGYAAFRDCTSLQSVNLPNCSYIGEYAFGYCHSLQSINLPNCSYIERTAFYSCSSLQFVNLPNCSYIRYYAFDNCFLLSKIILGYSSIVSIPATDIFANTPIADSSYLGYYGSIYVPTSLVESYKTARYWSYYLNRITSIVE